MLRSDEPADDASKVVVPPPSLLMVAEPAFAPAKKLVLANTELVVIDTLPVVAPPLIFRVALGVDTEIVCSCGF